MVTAWTRVAAAAALGAAVTVLGIMGDTALAAESLAADSRSFITSDGARLHYLEAGPSLGVGRPGVGGEGEQTPIQTIVFVPGWCMPGWIFERQIEALRDRFHVIALDPRGQGESEVTPFGYTAERRGRDIGELIAAAAPGRRVVIVGWSLGVLDALAYVREAGDARIAGLVLIDNSIGEEPAPHRPAGATGSAADAEPLPEAERTHRRAAFVAGMFAHDPGTDYRARLTAQALRMTQADERRLLAYDVPREDWRRALHSTDRPVLYVVRPRWREQGGNLVRTHADARMAVFETAGHALFVDESERFNRLLIDFFDGPVARGERAQ